MSLKFACNLSFMFPECPSFLGRYQLAKKVGFKAVESGFPLGFSVEQVVEAKTKANVQQVLINVFTGRTFHFLFINRFNYYKFSFKNLN